MVAAANEPDDQQHPTEPGVFLLKYAMADSLADIIDQIFADSELRIAFEPRLNAVIVRSEPKVIEQVEKLVEALDRPTEEDSDEPTEAQARRIALTPVVQMDCMCSCRTKPE